MARVNTHPIKENNLGTATITPSQSNFAEDFILNYPGSRPDIVGQIVGPNWLGEFFVIREVEVVDSYTRAKLAILTGDRKQLLSTEVKREFVTQTLVTKEARSAYLDPKKVEQEREHMRSPHMWFQREVRFSQDAPKMPSRAVRRK